MIIREAFAQHPINPITGTTSVPIGGNFGLGYDTLGEFVSLLVPLFFSIAAIMVTFYFFIGAFELITSQGDKAHIVSARSKIYHAIIGLILLLMLFLILQYILYDVFHLVNFRII